MDLLQITWPIIERMVQNVAEKIKKSNNNITSIYGIPRGGMIPAVLLSHELGIPLTTSLTSGSLIVDDMVDSGETMKIALTEAKLSNSNKEVYTAVLFKRDTSTFTPDFHGRELSEPSWVVYPWENKMNASQDRADYDNKPRISKNPPKKFPRDLPFLQQKS